MKNYIIRCCFYLFLLLLLHFQSVNVQSKSRQHPQHIFKDAPVVQVYLPFWNDGYQPDAAIISRLSTVALAFAIPQKNGAVTYDHSLQKNLDVSLKAIQDAKKINPNLKILWAIGGWDNSDNFTFAVRQPVRRRFVTNIINFLNRFNADGLDIDWEFPKVSDRANLTEFVKEFFAEAKKRRKDYQITMAVNGAGGENIAGLDIPKLAPYLHHFNVMTYDFYGDWSEVAGLHSAVYQSSRLTDNKLNVAESVDFYLKSGVPAKKIVIGAVSYGRIQGAESGQSGDGLGEKSFKSGSFVFRGRKYSDEISYYEIKKLPSAWQRFFDEQAQAPYLYNQVNKTFISYDDVRSIQAKTKLIKDKNLGGIMIWDMPGDTDNELIGEIIRGLNN